MLKKLLRSRQNEFFDMFAKIGDNVGKGVELLSQLISSPERYELIDQIKDLETKGDDYTRKLIQTLNQTFITPFDREDVHQLAEMMDDVLDNANTTAVRLRLFNITAPLPEIVEITKVFCEQARHLAVAMRQLEDHRQIFDICARVDELETRADYIYNSAIARMFNEKMDALEIIKQKDIIEILEEATDECEDISDLLKSIVIKYA